MPKMLRKILTPNGRGSVLVIAMLLISSATIRLATSANSAIAQDGQLPNATMPAKQTVSQAEAEMPKYAEKSGGSAAEITNRDDVSSLIGALSVREKQLVEREKALEMRLRALAIADAEIEKRIVSLTETEQALRATLSLADEASEKDLLRLTSVYESMKPKDAAALFEEMEPNFAAGFLGRMRPDVAAAILAGLSPQVAYSISVILAGRNATVPKT